MVCCPLFALNFDSHIDALGLIILVATAEDPLMNRALPFDLPVHIRRQNPLLQGHLNDLVAFSNA